MEFIIVNLILTLSDARSACSELYAVLAQIHQAVAARQQVNILSSLLHAGC
jgi:hypothetical protein